LRVLTKLELLDLTGNEMSQWNHYAFFKLVALKELRLAQNKLQEAVDAGAFVAFPATVETLDLSGSNLKEVPDEVLVNTKVTHLTMANNVITKLNHDDFRDNNGLINLDLSENPISVIEDNTFATLKSVQYLGMKQLTLPSIDLAMFNGMDQLKRLSLDFQRVAQFDVQVSDVNKVPQSIENIGLSHTAVSEINPNFATIVARSGFKQLDLTRDQDSTCDSSLQWMAKYALCTPKLINVDGAKCSNMEGMLLRDYLQTLQPQC
jgi:Leucine-rich repeat (LRR) protein